MSRGPCLTQRLLIAFIITVTGLAAQSPQEPVEQWYNPGIGPGAPQDLRRFVTTTDAMFVGRLAQMSVAFIDEKQEWLFTKLTFRPTEWIKASPYPVIDTIEVLTTGGTYVEIDGRRAARKPAEIAQTLQIGASYFVPVTYETRPNLAWTGTYALKGRDAIIRMDATDVAPVYTHSRWPDAILAQAPQTLSVPGQFPNRRELFLATLRAAVAAHRR